MDDKTSWLVPARLKTKALRSEADAAGELTRRLQNDANSIRENLARLEERKATLLADSANAGNIVNADARKARQDYFKQQLAPVLQEIELLQAGLADLSTRQDAAQAAAAVKIRPAYGAEQVLKHINGGMPGVSIGSN
ncbi:MAG: hypothetical protein CVU32_01825 [Betaproteobacteria bacterium HGW-Betaproteobacteria-5]|jgi:chromosome segregation ATPase|nr:MAG: hypothetical protein CVU32_01825 [Betaproteobacteria bacterium HGW-Betaproteobacteria-5]PKO40151.1 MAG: hypothetical protein CVU33_03035 [Betaproteobacteria bacterium HGW-Betaproteobacteria-6]PKO93188.1 MAG: hypothetical protein CVU16_05790 [Betaproteobacteria bacterium HGW-Betaproteobacteria-10]